MTQTPDTPTAQHKTVERLKWIILRRQSDEERQFFAKPFDINTQDDQGKTVLHHVIDALLEEDVEELFQRGASPNIPDQNGVTPFTWAVRTAKLKNAKLALAYGADVAFQASPYSRPPLCHAIEVDAMSPSSGQSRTIFLLNHGASLDQIIHLPDGTWKKAGEYAYDADQEAGKPIFENVIKGMYGRSLSEDFARAKAMRAAQLHLKRARRRLRPQS